MRNASDATVEVKLVPTWDVLGGQQQWRACVSFDGELAFFESGETVERALANLATTLARNLKRKLDREVQQAEEQRLRESR